MEVFENSWHIAIPDLKKHDTINHHYICTCGYIKQIALQNHYADFPYLICPECSNSYYLDLETFRDSHTVRYWKTFKWSYELIEDKEGWHIHFYYLTPVLKNSLSEFAVHKQSLQKMSLFYNGVLQTTTRDQQLIKCYIYDDDNTEIRKILEKQYAQPLLRYVLDNINETLNWIDIKKYSDLSDNQTLHVLAFFLQHPHMKDEGLFFWDYDGCDTLMNSIHNEDEGLSLILGVQQKKSIKRALFSNYKANKGSFYSPMFDYVVCHHFEDENFIVVLLKIEHHTKRALFHTFKLEEILQVFGFLAQYYLQQELYRLIVESISETSKMQEFHDIVRMLNEEEFLPLYLEHFRKPRSNVKALHDELVRIHIRYITVYKLTEVKDIFIPFEYETFTAQSFTCRSASFEFRLPYSPEELYTWTLKLHNCMASYTNDIIKKRTLIVGVFRDDTLLYALEIKNGRIVQALGKYNKPIIHNDSREIRDWFKGLHVKNKNLETREVA